ncbi:GerMN domain-containing protein [Aquihabitans daechungensis]|uniref:GerMN domain-containing protein n=1 Tax=Aquihabitans daechungensis TaxID=1052257 RepID=UPI003BA2737C
MNRTSRAIRACAAALAAVLVAALAGCGVTSQGRATRIEPEDVPFGLLEDQPTTTSFEAGKTATMYLLSDDRLVAVDRSVPEDGGLVDLLGQVITGPSEVEQSLGITTAVPAGTIASVDTSRGIAEVDLTSSFGDIRSREQILALGQIVFTLTGQPGIGGVRFTVEGEDVIVPLSDGTLSDDPLSRDDFEAVAPD